ncbi:MAG: hypothetical protein H0Z32_14950 [Bacillaceae bacterium]|nr:hypothetical protein [Bacillaceae bacterium]
MNVKKIFLKGWPLLVFIIFVAVFSKTSYITEWWIEQVMRETRNDPRFMQIFLFSLYEGLRHLAEGIYDFIFSWKGVAISALVFFHVHLNKLYQYIFSKKQ